MQTTTQEILHTQKTSWNTFSPGWRTWDDFTMRFLAPQGVAIIDALGVQDGHAVLDIAAGTGDPGLSLATERHDVDVTAIDVSEGMLAIARDKASARRLSNFRTRVGDACQLEFEDDSFDAVSCRLGFMFFPDLAGAAREMARVLVPGASVATTVWSEPAHNPWITTFMRALGKYVELPKPNPHGPGLFRCAAADMIPGLFRAANLRVERVELLRGSMRCASVDEYWNFMTAVVPPAVAALRNASPDLVARVRGDLEEQLVSPEAGISLGWGAHLLVAKK